MAGATTFPAVPWPGVLRCREAEHSSPAAPARERSSLLGLGKGAGDGKARLKRALGLLRSLLLAQRETQPSLLSRAEERAAGSRAPPMATARAWSVSGGGSTPLERLGNTQPTLKPTLAPEQPSAGTRGTD